MKVYFIIIFFIIGTVLGSFYNVVGYRLSKNQSLIKPGSHCVNCNHKLKVWELIPILSYIFLKGKCSNCKQKISSFYPIIELITGLLFAVSFYSFGFSYDLLLVLSVVSLFSIVIVSDLNFYIIPDQVNIFFAVVIFIINILNYGFKVASKYLVFGLIMFLFMYFVMLLGNLLFKKESLGGGDIKLLFVLGMCLPIQLSFVSLIVSVILALPLSIYLLFSHKDRVLPFGPFLVSGTLLILMLKIDVNQINQLLNIFII